MNGRPGIDAFLDHLGRVLRRNAQRYGTRDIQGPAQVLARARDKIERLDRALREGWRDDEDAWTDLAGYGGIGWLLSQGLWDERAALKRVYLAHPIDAGEEDATAERVRDLLMHSGYAVYWPRGAFHGVKGQAGWIWPVNLEAIRLCDIVLALMPRATPGVSAELLYGKEHGKVVWVWAGSSEVAQSSLVQWTADRIFIHLERLWDAITGEGGSK